jgi:hypothetical protein
LRLKGPQRCLLSTSQLSSSENKQGMLDRIPKGLNKETER